MAANPMHQFKVYRIGPEIEISGIDLSFTNASLFMVISAVLITLLLLFGTKEKKLIPSKIQLISEMLYNFIAKLLQIKPRLPASICLVPSFKTQNNLAVDYERPNSCL